MNLRALRKRHGKTIQDVATGVGVVWRTVLRWELGQSEPSGHNLIALASYFQKFDPKVKPGDLIGRAA